MDKLGPAYGAAEALDSLAAIQALPSQTLDAFAALTPGEVALLPVRMRAFIPSIRCAQLNNDEAPDPFAGSWTVLCDTDTKLVLDSPALTGAEIASAKDEIGTSGDWVVTVAFNDRGRAAFSALTRDLAPVEGRVAIVVDRTVVSAPVVQGVITDEVQISGGDLTRTKAFLLAAQMTGGELPLRLTIA